MEKNVNLKTKIYLIAGFLGSLAEIMALLNEWKFSLLRDIIIPLFFSNLWISGFLCCLVIFYIIVKFELHKKIFKQYIGIQFEYKNYIFKISRKERNNFNSKLETIYAEQYPKFYIYCKTCDKKVIHSKCDCFKKENYDFFANLKKEAYNYLEQELYKYQKKLKHNLKFIY